MSDELPTPLVPPDVDLRGLEWMPLFGNHLLGSEFHAMCDDAAWRAGVTLWWRAWNQVPAASLPNDDAALARLADLGRDVKAWRRMRERALHGFELCSDGRLYHRFLAKQALVAWDKRLAEREKKRAWRERQKKDAAGDGPVPPPSPEPGHRPGHDGDAPGDGTAEGKRSEANGREAASNPSAKRVGDSSIPGGDPECRAALKSLLETSRVRIDAKAEMHVRQWSAEGVTEAQLADAIAIARDRKPQPEVIAIGYLVPILGDVLRAGVRGGDTVAAAKALIAEREAKEAARAAH